MKVPNTSEIQYYLIVVAIGVVVGVAISLYYAAFALLWGLVLPVIQDTRRLVFVFTTLGLAASFLLVMVFAKTKTTGSGTHVVLETLHLRNGDISLRDTIVKPAASILTIGMGGAAGLEGPSLVLGGGLGAYLGRLSHLPYQKHRKVFLAGAAAGLSAIFKAPLTGILFALEIPYKRDLEKEVFIEASIASVTSYLVTVSILGPAPIFHIGSFPVNLDLYSIFLSIVLGVVGGAYSFLFVQAFNFADRLGKRFLASGGFGLLLLSGGLALGAIGYVNLDAIGIGYSVVTGLVRGTLEYTVLALAILLILRLCSTVITLAFGGSGGLFIPSIIEGSILGAIFSQLALGRVDPLFIAVGVSAVLAGTHKILLTPVAFVAETIGPSVIIPVLLASIMSYFTSGSSSFFPLQPYSRMKDEDLALERIYSKVSRTAPKVVNGLKAKDVMTARPVSLKDDATIDSALSRFATIPYRVLPIVHESGVLIGAVTLEDLLSAPKSMLGHPVTELYMSIPLTVQPEEPLPSIVSRIFEKEVDHVFVVDEEGRLLGVIAVIDIARKLVHYYAG
ncbi:MAG TPA: chloride channel protein [Conexivisphaerales archaeon]|nr:chloride channel protein [Conexivisphaerales archaeon]